MTTSFLGPGVIATAHGPIDLAAPDPDAVPPVAWVARTLGLVCRFGGHVPTFYSVAQHAVHVARLVWRDMAGHPWRARLTRAALHHDDGEAFVGDVVSPLKLLVPRLGELDRGWARACAVAYGVDPDLLTHPAIKHADLVAYVTEERDLRGRDVSDACGIEADERPIYPLSPHEAVVERWLHADVCLREHGRMP